MICPIVTGAIGLLGTKPSWNLMQHCDTLLVVGQQLPVRGVSARGGQGARRCRSTSTPRMLGLRYPMEVNLCGDSAETLRALLPLLRQQDRSRLAQGDREGSARVAASCCDERAMLDADPINPQRVFWELNKRLPDRCILTADSGSCCELVGARHARFVAGMMASLSGNLATMGPGVPYALAAKFASSGPARDRAGRRRRHADERHQRADHDREVLEAVVGSAPDRARAQQPAT